MENKENKLDRKSESRYGRSKLIYELLNRVFYIRKAIGKGGKRINIYKLRTMYPGTKQKIPYLQRTRKYGIDELPQLLNIIRGDLNLVGPRPLEESTLRKLSSRNIERAQNFKPGLLGAHYAFKDIDHKNSSHMDAGLDKYYQSVENNGSSITNIIYGTAIAINLLFRGMRSK